MYINSSFITFPKSLWDVVNTNEYSFDSKIYNYGLLDTVSLSPDLIDPQNCRELSVRTIIQKIESEESDPSYSIEDRICALSALEKIQRVRKDKGESLVDTFNSIVSYVKNFFDLGEWVNDTTLDDRLLAEKIQKLRPEVDKDFKAVHHEINENEKLRPKMQMVALASGIAAKTARLTFQNTRTAVRAQSMCRGFLARRTFKEMQAVRRVPPSVVVSLPPIAMPLPQPVVIPAPSPTRMATPEPVKVDKPLNVTDEEVETMSRQFYIYDKTNPREVGEWILRVNGLLIGKTGRSLRQLFRVLSKNLDIVSLKAVPLAYQDFTITLKHSMTGTLPGTTDKITLPQQVHVQIHEEEGKITLKFEGKVLPDMVLGDDKVKMDLGWFKKVDKTYQEACAFIDKIKWTENPVPKG